MNAGYWAGDAIATSIGRARDRDRANREIQGQQGYHCGDIAVQRAALAELRRVDPENVLFKPVVIDRIWHLGEREFKRQGWTKGSALEVDPATAHAELLAEFEELRTKAIAAAEAEPVKHRRQGWPWARRDEFSWRKTVVATEREALALQAAELARLAGASLGDDL